MKPWAGKSNYSNLIVNVKQESNIGLVMDYISSGFVDNT